MRLVLDTNILIAALIRSGRTRELLLCPELTFLAPDVLLQEIKKYEALIAQKAKLSVDEVQTLLAELLFNIKLMPLNAITKRKEAERIMEAVDPKDTLFIALALSVPNDGIWSEDSHFEQQKRIKIWKTKALINRFLD